MLGKPSGAWGVSGLSALTAVSFVIDAGLILGYVSLTSRIKVELGSRLNNNN